jgi:hypothetical protein
MKLGIATLLLLGLVLVSLGCGGTASNSGQQQTAPAQAPVAATTPGPGDSIRIAGGGQQVDVTLVAVGKSQWMPFLSDQRTGAPGATPPADETWVIANLQFKNTGSTSYHSRVANWCWLKVKNNPGSIVNASGSEWDLEYKDLQPGGSTLEDFGYLQLDPGQTHKWVVAFMVLKGAKPVSLTYQGPGNKKVTWTL